GITISINLSARNLLDAGLHKHFIEQLRSDAGPTEPLMLEITESAIMADASRALEAINRLRDAGFRFSIDDFGTGYSSLAYIKNLPVEEIKIDKSFIINMVKNPNDAVIVRSTIDLVHNLNLKVVAEGVESQDIWDRLSALGCDEAQGYYMAKPMPAGDFTRWLHESPRGISQ
ncbi:MAG TPA: EAL domain-containing protein, partial [Nitrospiria bacterium]